MVPGHGLLTSEATIAAHFAEQVLGQAPTDPGDASARLLAIHARLASALAPIVGEHGFEAMFAASIRATRLVDPALASIAASGTDRPLHAFWAALRAQDPERVRRIELTSLTTFFELLADFIGDELALRIFRQAWPSVVWAAPEPDEDTP